MDGIQFAISVPLAVSLFCATLFGQSATPATQPQASHVRGTIRDPLEAVIRGVKVTFQNEQVSRTVTTNNIGVYEADLPLGNYTMVAAGPPGFRFYRRPLFRLTSLSSVVLNVTLLVGNPCGDMIIVNSSGEPVTDEQWNAATEHCRSEELIPIPSGDGLPLQLSIRYGSRTTIVGTNSYTGEKTRQYQTPVFVAYNLFSLQADKVTYDVQKRTIEARGNVIAVNESGATQRADSVLQDRERPSCANSVEQASTPQAITSFTPMGLGKVVATASTCSRECGLLLELVS